MKLKKEWEIQKKRVIRKYFFHLYKYIYTYIVGSNSHHRESFSSDASGVTNTCVDYRNFVKKKIILCERKKKDIIQNQLEL